ncbi:TetR/AcrR family transcriptional regulator [Bacillus sp. V3B]|uniref:TetR/AcrR family transcriptional regulator n=1 Tax=Bacillus sp. V3B TaxID=2804915 RepID=UPI00210C128B|nr:TetR/AcrR family transcriptional regulator [Bacillus sp. V3B]MCQ6276799.1 TetR/AcrR family transcriptional regulator [Bacillus sp. V3B]
MIKKQLIMEKALELFAKQGFESTSVQQITEHCGISKGAFYLSFKSKDELILALVDHFMIQITSDIDYKVKNTNNDEELLYEFYYAIFHSFHKYSDFAKFFIKEQTQSFNKELILKIRYYNRLMEKIILSMVERLYGEEVKHTKYDLIYCIKGFTNIYSELLLYNNISLDLDLLSQSLVEKTNLLAKHTTIPFISQDLIHLFKQPINEEVTKEQLIEMMEQKIEEVEDSIEKESLILLKQQLLKPNLSLVIVRGLLENIRNHPHCKWISYLLRSYYEF